MSVRSPTAGPWSSSQWRSDNEFETDKRWARNRIPTDRTMMEFEVGLARQYLERATDLELDGVELSVKAAEAGAAYRLTQARAELDKARGK